MKTTKKIPLAGIISTVALLVLFLVFTLVVRFADRAAIGPDGSEVGFSALNGAFHDLTAGDGYHETLYKLTDILEIIPFAIVLGFAVLVYLLPLVLFFVGYGVGAGMKLGGGLSALIGGVLFVVGILAAMWYSHKLKLRNEAPFAITEKL